LLQVYLIKGAFNANQLKNSLESNAQEFYKDVNRVSQPKRDHTPNDYGTNGGFTYSQGGLELIQAKNAWDITKGKEEIKIGVVEAQSFDNGFDTTHEDLKSQIAFIENGAHITDYNHGTSVAGVAGAATNNNKGLSSIGYKNKLLLFEGSLDVELYNDILKAANKGADIINCSFGSCVMENDEQAIIEMVNDKGVLITASAGNHNSCSGGPNFNLSKDNGLRFPASYNHVISVSSVNNGDNYEQGNIIHTFNDSVDLTAPGFHIQRLITDSSDLAPNSTIYSNKYEEHLGGWGTSLSAPIVAGVASLIKSINPCFTPEDVEQILKETADDVTDTANNATYAAYDGAGRVNAFNAVKRATNYGFGDTTLTTSTTLNGYNISNGNIDINGGVTLTVTGNLNMTGDDVINVKEGAKLVVDGGKLYCECDNNTWQGIRVWGNSNKSQSSGAPHQSPYHGKVVLKNGATIANAKIGVSTSKLNASGNIDWSLTGGGIVQGYNSTFKNNAKCVEFYKFHNPDIVNGEPNNFSEFENCEFLITDDPGMPIGKDTTRAYADKAMVSLWDVKGVEFEGCKFINKEPESFKGVQHGKGLGIYSLDATFRVDNSCGLFDRTCENPSPTVFKNLAIGIEWHGSGLDVLDVTDSRFFNNQRGIALQGGRNANIFGNTFKTNDDYVHEYDLGVEETMGIYAKHHDQIGIESNDFLDSAANEEYEYRGFGVVINNSLPWGGGVINNKFKLCSRGLQTEDDNRRLIIQCNMFSHNGNDAWKGTDLMVNPKFGGQTFLFPDFGFCGYPSLGIPINGFDTKDPGNAFVSNSEMNIIKGTTYYIPPSWEESGQIDYAVSDDNSSPPESSLTDPQSRITLCEADRLEDCQYEDEFEDEGLGLPDETYMQDSITSVGDNITGLQDSIDNGSTSGTLDTLADTETDSTDKSVIIWEITPHVSDTVLKFTILECLEIEENELKDILIANSPLTYDVMQALENREPPLDQSIIDEIEDHQDGSLSDRKILRNYIQHIETHKQQLINRNMRYYMHHALIDSINENNSNYRDSARQYLVEDTSFAARQMLIRSLIEEDKITAAQEYLNHLESGTGEIGEFKDLMNILIALKNEGINIYQMNDSQMGTLETIATDSHRTALYAQAILSRVTDTNWTYDPWKYQYEETQEKRFSDTEEQQSADQSLENQYVSVYPNPADNQINFQYKLPAEEGHYQLELFNLSGKVVSSLDLNEQKGEQKLSTKTWRGGIYFYKLVNKQSVFEMDRFVILK